MSELEKTRLNFMKITVYGCGYVGLVTAALFADTGNTVIAVDIDKKKIEGLKAGRIPIYEPGLTAIIERNLDAKRLTFTTDIQQGAEFGQLQFIAVGTPSSRDGSADLQYVLKVATQIGNHLNQEAVIIDKSTVPVGTADQVKATLTNALKKRKKTFRFSVVSNPEFLKEGAAIADFKRPDRIVIGSEDSWAIELMKELYAPFNRNHDRIIVMDVRSAELTKYAANALLATKISFINEVSQVAEAVGADIEKVRHGIGADPRIGYHFIYAGCGYGGSCFPKDVRALTFTAAEHGIDLNLIPSVTRVNNSQKGLLFDKMQRYFGESLREKHIAVWGLAFKPNTDDLREAPSITLLEALWKLGITTTVYDPKAMPVMKKQYPQTPQLSYANSALDACQSADALVIVTDWREFSSPDFDTIKSQLNQPIIFDGRNLFDPKRLKKRGFRYFGIGRGETLQ